MIIASSDMTALREVDDFELDMAFGSDENDFEFSCAPEHAPEKGGYVFIDGTEYGGTVDKIETSTDGGVSSVTVSGRTWHGILAGKVLIPRRGANLTVEGSCGDVLQQLLALMGLEEIFAAETGGAEVSYTFPRFPDGYSAIRAMLRASGMKLRIRCIEGTVWLSGEPIATIGDVVDSDIAQFTLTESFRTTNHLVCAGAGEGEAREVIHLYADADGNVSQTQTLFGVDEVAALYDYSNADHDTLLEDGTAKLQEMQGAGTVDAPLPDDIGADVGDIVVGRDNATGIVVAAEVAKKIVKVKDGRISFSYEAGDPSVASSASGTSSTTVAGGGGGIAYAAGEGIAISGGTISATPATENAAGSMSASDKAKLDGIAPNATNVTVDVTISSTSTNPVQSKAVSSALGGKANISHTHAAADVVSGILPVTRGGTGNSTGKAASADKLSTARDISITGAVVGSASFDGSKAVTIDTTSTADPYEAGVGIAIDETVISATPATTTAAGSMSAADKAKLDGIAEGANKYSLPTAGKDALGGVKTTSSVTNSLGYTPTPIIGGVPYYMNTNTTYSDATTTAHGLMSAADKTKLDGIATGATKVTVDASLSSTSANPVQNKAVNTALNGKADASHTHAAADISSGILPVSRGGTGNATGKATSAEKLATACRIILAGDVEGEAEFDGSTDATVECTVVGGGGGSGAAYVTSKGTTSGWSWRKWSDGTAECWGMFTFSVNITSAWGSLYESTTAMSKAYPFSFAAIPTETVSLMGNAGTMLENFGSNSMAKSGTWYAIRPDSRSGITCYLNIHVIGKI